MAHSISVPEPDLQADFAESLSEIRQLYLQDALLETVAALPIGEIDQQLNRLVPEQALSALASQGMRGELLFPVPLILNKNPFLLGYYRLLLGFSRKAFYRSEFDLSRFIKMEDEGRITDGNVGSIEPLCKELIRAAGQLLGALQQGQISSSLLDDLTLLTLGAQLRGGANVQKGAVGIKQVFQVVEDIVADHAREIEPTRIRLLNAAGRPVVVGFASDPDIIIREAMASANYRNIIAIEVKAGKDYSNIHNRIGEAEKSHQKAHNRGYVECWTVYNVDGLDLEMARQESPTTDRFYKLDDLLARAGEEFEDFKARIISLTGVPSS